MASCEVWPSLPPYCWEIRTNRMDFYENPDRKTSVAASTRVVKRTTMPHPPLAAVFLICVLFNDTASGWKHVLSTVGWLMNYELERMWQERFVALFKVLSLCLSEWVKQIDRMRQSWMSVFAAEVRTRNLSNACRQPDLLELTSSVNGTLILETKCWQFAWNAWTGMQKLCWTRTHTGERITILWLYSSFHRHECGVGDTVWSSVTVLHSLPAVETCDKRDSSV